MTNSTSAPTAGVLIIGDEILKGQVRDTNSHFILSRLYTLGVRVLKVSVVGDDVTTIAKEVCKFSQLFSYVITSGGVGPTHDDVTFQGIAHAFNETLSPHPELLKIYAKFYKTNEQNAAVMKLASVPQSAKLSYSSDHSKISVFPNISVRNVYIFPGVPVFLEKSFSILCEDVFSGTGSRFYQTDLFLSCDEISIVEQLTSVVKECPGVNFGSYPQFDQSHYRVKLTIEADQKDLITKAISRLMDVLPKGCVSHFEPAALNSSYDDIMSLSVKMNMKHVRKSLQDVFKVLSDFRGYNGALVVDASSYGIIVLHLINAAAEKLGMKKTDIPIVLLLEEEFSTISIQHLQDSAVRNSLTVKGPCDLSMAIPHLKSLCPNLTLLIVGTQSKTAALCQQLDTHFGANNIQVFDPVSKWHHHQVLEFVQRLNTNH